ncbi:hypothetical protein ACOME3_009469 [Neoechinorhynchus agilis]
MKLRKERMTEKGSDLSLYIFQRLAFEAIGAVGPSTAEFLIEGFKMVGHNNHKKSSCSKLYFYQRISDCGMVDASSRWENGLCEIDIINVRCKIINYYLS